MIIIPYHGHSNSRGSDVDLNKSYCSLSIRPSYGARGEEILDGGGGEGEEKGGPDTKPFSKSCDTSKIWMWQ